MRELTGHKVNGCNDEIKIQVVDKPGSGGANHRYEITGFDPKHNPSADLTDSEDTFVSKTILFQNGPLKESGVNGITHEVLLAILIDRMEGFQSGPYASADNQEALEAMRTAQTALQRRTMARVARGVEGTMAI